MKRVLLCIAVPFFVSACARMSVDPIEVKTIHIEHNVNIRVAQRLDEFFAFEEAAATQPTTQTTQPATTAPVVTAQGVSQ